jgi:hypothetical protein
MKNAYFHRGRNERTAQPLRHCQSWLWLLVMATGLSAHGQTVALQTTTDSNGWFRYSFVYGHEDYRVGGASNALAVWLPARAVIGVEATPGWTWRTDTTDSICWHYVGATPCVLQPGVISFAYTSAWRDTVVYNETSRTGALPCAQITGEWFHTNGVRVVTTSVAADVRGVNIVCLNRAVLVGPAVPETLAGAWWGAAQCGLLLWQRRHRAAPHAGRGDA